MSESALNPLTKPGVEVVPTADGYVVYDDERDRIHYLNHTAALVLEFCTGANTEAQIAGLLQKAYELPEPPTQETRDCIETLRDEGLIE